MKIALIVAMASLCLAAVVSQVSETSVTAPFQTNESATETTLIGAPVTSEQTDAGEPSENPDGAASNTVPAQTVSTIEVTGGHDLVVDDTAPTPIRVRIPALGVDIDLASVGVDQDGDFDVPQSGVGWYRFGPSPGEDGSSVLAAHVDYNGAPGAFFRLEELVEGDEIEIDSDDGITRTFVVVSQVLYDKTALPADDLFRENGEETLRLITCGGTFDASVRSYVGNRVVSAVPIGERPTSG